MDNLEPQSPAPRTELPDLQQQYESLRHLVVSVLILVLIVSGTFNIFLFRQYRVVSKEFAPMKPQMTQILSECSKINSVAQEFAKRAVDFSKTHPDFAPVLAKFNLSAMAQTGAPPAKPAAPPATPTPPPAKK